LPVKSAFLLLGICFALQQISADRPPRERYCQQSELRAHMFLSVVKTWRKY
jgi:hypothetical protein